jgi:hypothetical protein
MGWSHLGQWHKVPLVFMNIKCPPNALRNYSNMSMGLQRGANNPKNFPPISNMMNCIPSSETWGQPMTFNLLGKREIYLWRKVVCLFCTYEIHRTRMLQIAFLVFLESSQWGGVHGLGFMVFRLVVQSSWILMIFSLKNK